MYAEAWSLNILYLDYREKIEVSDAKCLSGDILQPQMLQTFLHIMAFLCVCLAACLNAVNAGKSIVDKS